MEIAISIFQKLFFLFKKTNIPPYKHFYKMPVFKVKCNSAHA